MATLTTPIVLPNQWQPTDHGLIAWAYDPPAATTTTIPAAGTLNIVRLKLLQAASITNVWLSIQVAGSTLTAGQNFAGIYQAGTLIGATADQTTPWQTANCAAMALVGGPFAVTAGDLIVAFYANGTTRPSFARGVTALQQANVNLVTTSARFGTANTGLTTALPGSLGTVASASPSYWAAVS